MPAQFQIVIFAVLAAVALFALYNVLGKKVGHQPQEDAKTPALPAQGAPDSVVARPAIDANTQNGAATNEAFTFIGTNVNWGGVAGELRAIWTATGQIIEGDVNGDRKADFSIFIEENGGHSALSGIDGVDFVL